MKKRGPSPTPKRPRGRPAHKTSARPRNLRELAGPLGVSYQTAQKLRKDGIIHVEKDGTYDVAKCKRAASVSAHRGKAGSIRVSDPDEPNSGAGRHWDTEYRKIKYARELIALNKERGLLVSRDDVRSQWVLQAKHVKDALVVVGRELAHKCVGKGAREIAALIDARLAEILRRLAHPEFNPNGTNQPPRA